VTAAGPALPPPEPPYILTDRPGVAVTGDAGLAVAEVVANGPWSPHLSDQLCASLQLCLAGPPAPIIVDLKDLADPAGESLSFWLALWRQARFQVEPVHLTFCVPTTAALSRRFRYLPGPQPRVFATVPEARAAVAERMSHFDRLQAHLQPRPESVRAARTLVALACDVWERPDLRTDTSLVVSELAANAVEHARTEFVVTVSRSETGLHLAIHDRLSRFPHTSESELATLAGPSAVRGRGLRLVHTIAAAWGAMPTREGKVVWATVT
jgi:anti-sigma regulatory factor (Ser/Thr protein kinase)